MIQGEIRNFLQDIGAAANSLGHEVYIVGGYVRNLVCKHCKQSHSLTNDAMCDIDLVIDTNAIEFIYKYQRYYEDNHPQHLTFSITNEFKEFGTVKIQHPEFPDYEIEFASTRTETYPSAAAFPKVSLIDDIQSDLPRRDFTINALLLSLNRQSFEEIIDYNGGLNDMDKGLIRVFHDLSFIDDPTRIYRAFRFSFEYDFQIEERTKTLIEQALKDERMPLWLKKRKNRFDIERKRIESLGITVSKDNTLEGSYQILDQKLYLPSSHFLE